MSSVKEEKNPRPGHFHCLSLLAVENSDKNWKCSGLVKFFKSLEIYQDNFLCLLQYLDTSNFYYCLPLKKNWKCPGFGILMAMKVINMM